MKKRSAGRPPSGHHDRPARELRLHEGFVGARSLIGTPYLASAERRDEYEREIAPRTEEALGRILGKVYGGTARPALPRRCLDLGAGTGAATRTVKRFFATLPTPQEVEVIGVDRVPAEGLLVADLSRPDSLPRLEPRFELIVEAHLLNELLADRNEDERPARLATLVRRWIADHLAPTGVLILLEPALRETSRVLLAVRDALLADGTLHVLAPCLSDAPCPARAKPRDWCHDAVPSTTPTTPRVDFSYLVLQRATNRAADTGEQPASSFRVVSDRLSEKGRLRVYGCGSTGRVALIRLDKHRSPENEAFAGLERGDRVSLGEMAEAQDGLRVLPSSHVRREPG